MLNTVDKAPAVLDTRMLAHLLADRDAWEAAVRLPDLGEEVKIYCNEQIDELSREIGELK